MSLEGRCLQQPSLVLMEKLLALVFAVVIVKPEGWPVSFNL